MKIAVCKLESKKGSPYSQSRAIQVPKLARELDRDFEERVWRERCNSTENGQIFIPPMAFANSLKEAAKYLSLPIPGKARQTFTKHFESGIMVSSPVYLPEMKDDVKGEWLFVPSDGRAGGGTRVWKCFPVIPTWSGEVTYTILDDIITKESFREVLEASGTLIGIGRFRPRNRGYYGMFDIKSLDWDNGE